MITVAILPSDSRGCGFYRLFSPLLRLKQRGEIELICHENSAGMFSLSEEEVKTSDVVILQKAGVHLAPPHVEEGMTAMMKEHGRKMVYEVDDLLWQIPCDDPGYEEVLQHSPGWAARIRDRMQRCRIVTCTTDVLAAELSRIHNRIRVVPNGIDLDVWRDPSSVEPEDSEPGAAPAPARRDTSQVRIGYLASVNHRADARLLIQPFRRIARDFPQAQFIMAGGFWPQLKAALGDRIHFFNGRNILDYPKFARALNLDVGVAPLEDSRFSRCKSALKALEYTALGIPTIASAVAPYSKAEGIKDSVFLCHSTTDWVRALTSCMQASHRELAAQKALRALKEFHTVDHSADAWLKVLREIAS